MKIGPSGFRVAVVAVLGLSALIGPRTAHADLVGGLCYVNANATPPGDGSSWETAYISLQSALAEPNCEEIWVAAGVYTPGVSQSDSFLILPHAEVYGGFDGTETSLSERDPAAHVTILSGDIDGNDDNNNEDGHFIDETAADITGNNSQVVVYLDGISTAPVTSSTVLDGFTITGGSAFGAEGGGLSCRGEVPGAVCSPTLSNLIFSGNSALNGGAIFNAGQSGGVSSPTLTNVTFTGNSASFGGAIYNDGHSGGLSNPSLSNVTFIGNTGHFGGAIYNDGRFQGVASPSLTEVTFSANTALSNGGAIYNDAAENGASSPTLTNVTINDNTATYGGGAIFNQGFNGGVSSPIFTNVDFSGNSSTTSGGAIYNLGQGGTSSPSLTDVTFSGNTASANGGAIYNDGSENGDSSPTLTDVTLSGNSASYGGAIFNDGSANGSSSPALTDVTFSGNQAGNQGGAIFNLGLNGVSSPTFTNVAFSDNEAEASGGGAVFNEGGGGVSSPTFLGTAFINNTAWMGGGAVANEGYQGESSPAFTDVTFSGNSAFYGGAMWSQGTDGSSHPTLTHVTFSGNHADQHGGGMYNEDSGPTLQDSTFAGNTSGSGWGAGMFNLGGDPVLTRVTFSSNLGAGEGTLGGGMANVNSSPTLSDVAFLSNAAHAGGGMYNEGNGVQGVSSPTLTNVTFSGNSAADGGAILNNGLNYGTSSPTLTNVTFSTNQAGSNGGAIYSAGHIGGVSSPTLVNVILWADSAGAGGNEIVNIDASAAISYSLVQGGCESISGAVCGDGNLDSDPLLGALHNNGGYTETMALITGSPAIDAGSNTGCPSTDQRGQPRPMDGNHDGTAICDIGAFESPLFADVPVGGKEWMEGWIDAFYSFGITSGCGIGPLIYCPENEVTRAETAVFILRAKHGAGWTPPAATGVFSDVPVTGKEWMQPWIEAFYNESLTTGCGVDPLIYCPERAVTRAEMAVFIIRAIHAPGFVPPDATHIFFDVPVAGKEWMERWIEHFYSHGITTGCGIDPLRFCPENNTTRAEMAVFIDRAYALYP